MDAQFTLFLLATLAALIASWFLAPVAWARGLLALARSLTGMRSRSIDVDGVRWHYLEGGRGPVLVAVHGFGADADHWLHIALGLRRRYRIIAPDLPGFGTSATGEGLAFDIASQAARLEAFLDRLGVNEPLLLGSSMGGWIVTQYAATRPERARALWLMAPLGATGCRESPLLTAIDTGRDSPVRLASRADFERNVVTPMFYRRPWIPYPFRVFYGRLAVQRCAEAERIFKQVRGDSTPLEELARRVSAPVLLQWGEEDEAVDVSCAGPLREAFANIEVHVHPRTGHLPMLEIPVESLRVFGHFEGRQGGGQGHFP
ncbi:MAG: alpha/beta fold hydrolase [Xanthomonadales bacterium]|nr:alpha/beta fold hydrolase [Xanthomonadales bacterium]NIX12087.1 alpha/beta fold hydrolase [Xanthomonadales bacterium]